MTYLEQGARFFKECLVFLKATNTFQRLGLGCLSVACCLTIYASTLQFSHLDPVVASGQAQLSTHQGSEVFSAQEKSSTPSSQAVQPTPDLVTVELSGAVVRPGVYSLEKTKRIADVVDLAGGFSKTADKVYVSKNINLATRVSDALFIYVPSQGESLAQSSSMEPQTSSIGVAAQQQSGESMVNVNSASIDQLETLRGVGAARAQSIIDHRPYQSIDEFKQKAGIPSNVMLDIASALTF